MGGRAEQRQKARAGESRGGRLLLQHEGMEESLVAREGLLRPAASSELFMHLAVYRARTDVNAVVHAHPPVATGFATAGQSVTPQQAQDVSPEAVQTIARQAATRDPSIMDKAASFYAQHPTLVKAIGATPRQLVFAAKVSF